LRRAWGPRREAHYRREAKEGARATGNAQARFIEDAPIKIKAQVLSEPSLLASANKGEP